MSDDRPLSPADAVLADALGEIIAKMQQEWQRQWQRDLDQLRSESRATVAELRAATLEILLEKHDSQAAAKLKSITGGRS